MAIETTETGRKVYICDECGHVWVRRVAGQPLRCTSPGKHRQWNRKERTRAEKREKPGRKKRVPARRVSPEF